jgi:hypothetical protein
LAKNGLGNIFGHLLTISSVVTLNMFNVVIVHIFSLTWILRFIEMSLFLMIYLSICRHRVFQQTRQGIWPGNDNLVISHRQASLILGYFVGIGHH